MAKAGSGYESHYALVLFDRNLSQQLEVAEHFARAQHHAAQRVIGYRDRQPSFFADAFIQILKQRSAPGEHDSPITDVGRKLRRSPFERYSNRVHDSGDTFAQRLANFAVIHGDG